MQRAQAAAPQVPTAGINVWIRTFGNAIRRQREMVGAIGGCLAFAFAGLAVAIFGLVREYLTWYYSGRHASYKSVDAACAAYHEVVSVGLILTGLGLVAAVAMLAHAAAMSGIL